MLFCQLVQAPTLSGGMEDWAAADATLLQPLLSPLGHDCGEGSGRGQPQHLAAARYYQQYIHMARLRCCVRCALCLAC